MNNSILTPAYLGGSNDSITVSAIENSNRPASSVAGFNWRRIDFPYLHTHTHWEILIVIKGKVKHIINDVTHTAHKGYTCLIRPTDKHKFIFDDKENSETLTFCFANDIAQKLFEIHPLLVNLYNSQSQEPLSFMLNTSTFEAVTSKTIAIQFFQKEMYEQYSILIINRLINAYVEQLLNKNEAYPDWFNHFLTTLRNPNTFKQSIPQIASLSNYSYQRLAILFKQYTGKTLVEYIKELKLSYAKEELLNTNKAVNEIALELNYESVSSLNHNFKKATGLSPLAYRKSNSIF